jgi:hypothetical protein
LCALRDGLDASDIVRFPENLYGRAQRGSSSRYTKIANEFAVRGAKLEDVRSAMDDELSNIGAKGINDVGWDILPGNYERYLHQIKLMKQVWDIGTYNHQIRMICTEGLPGDLTWQKERMLYTLMLKMRFLMIHHLTVDCRLLLK